MEMFEVKLEALMLNKAFDELDTQEQAYVLEHLTEVAYTNYHFILKNTVEALGSDETDLVPNPNIAETLKEHLEAKVLPAKTPLLFNIFQPQTLYRSVAVLAAVAIISSFFIVNQTSDKINTQKPEHIIVRVNPTGIKEKLDKVERLLPASDKVRIKRNVSVAKVNIEKDSTVNETNELIGLGVFEPLLCLDIEINEQMPCLNDQTLMSN